MVLLASVPLALSVNGTQNVTELDCFRICHSFNLYIISEKIQKYTNLGDSLKAIESYDIVRFKK